MEGGHQLVASSSSTHCWHANHQTRRDVDEVDILNFASENDRSNIYMSFRLLLDFPPSHMVGHSPPHKGRRMNEFCPRANQSYPCDCPSTLTEREMQS